MFFPVGLDQDEVRRTPWVSWLLIGANVVVFLLFALGGVPASRYGFLPADPEPARVITSLFLHADIFHLFANMIFLYLAGPFVEDAYGRLLFPILYFVSGTVAAAAHAAAYPESAIPLVGASGAISGVLGAFLVRYGRRRIQFLWVPLFPITSLRRRFSVPAFLYLPLWFTFQLLMAMLSPRETPVAFWAHVGGFLFGVFAALLIALTGVEKKVISPAIERKIGYRADERLVRAIEAARDGRPEEARALTRRILQADPGNLDARRYAYELALEVGDARELGTLATRLLDAYISRGEVDLARQLIREAGGAASDLPARFLLRAGDLLVQRQEPVAALELYRRLAESHPHDPAALRALLATAELERRAGDENAVSLALARARTHPGWSEQWAERFGRRRDWDGDAGG
jgi:membrane associated rhomboid family serine protease